MEIGQLVVFIFFKYFTKFNSFIFVYRYIQLKQFCGPDLRIYRQCPHLEGDITPPELIESTEGFEYREGPITVDKVFRDIWEVGEKKELKLNNKKKKLTKVKNVSSLQLAIVIKIFIVLK